MRDPFIASSVRALSRIVGPIGGQTIKRKPMTLPTLRPLPAFDPKRAAAGDNDKDD